MAAAGRLSLCVRRGDRVARVGGDEFAVLCEDVASEQQALVVADRIRRALGEPFRIGQSELVMGASVGIALAGTAATAAHRLVAGADIAVHRAKARGDTCIVFDEAMREQSADRIATEAQLRRAVEREELFLVFQPIVSIEGTAPVAVEALLRWRHPTRGAVPPAEFIPVAERTGLIVPETYGAGRPVSCGQRIASRHACSSAQLPEDEAILAAVTAMAKALGITVVAEGVETEAQATRLKTLGCRLAQGYYFARPGPAAELELLSSQSTARCAPGRAGQGASLG